jgi:hypothetical protein
VVITTLARYQTVFWIPVARRLAALGYTPGFLAFDDPSHDLITAAGLRSFNAFDLGQHAELCSAEELERELVETLGWSLPLALSHERVTFGLRDTRALISRLARHRAAAQRALTEFARDGRPLVVIQELGGFLSVIATYLAARAAGHENIFLEPSFFKGRFFATRNTFAAPRPGKQGTHDAPHAEALLALEAARASRAIVIPTKDKLHYSAALKKVVNAYNARRLVEKVWEKYGRRQRHEFGHLGRHVRVHLRMVANSVRMRGAHTALRTLGRFVYYPLHVPADVALTLRAPQYVDQLALVDYLARIVPVSHRVAIKEHPAQLGALDAGRMRQLLARYDNLVLLPPDTNNYDVLEACDLVVSVNSKSGAEALLLGRRVIVLGDAFYAASGLAKRVVRPCELAAAIRASLDDLRTLDRREIEMFFSTVWRGTLPGELYVAQDANASTFAESLDVALRHVPARALTAA